MREMNLDGSRKLSAGKLPTASFTRTDLVDLTLGSSSKGNQKKYCTLDGRFFVKERFNCYGRVWRDDLVEVVASIYASRCTLPTGLRVVKQGLCDVDGRPASYSESFSRSGFEFISYRRMRRMLQGSTETLLGTGEEIAEQIIAECSQILGYDARDLICAMFFLDCIVCNEDRHLNNFGFLCGVDGSVEFCTLFDFGLGMFECGSEYDGSKESMCIPDVRLKPCWFTQQQLVDYLLGSNSAVLGMVPKQVFLQEFKFPSGLAKSYFIWVNERFGVKIV